ncbi:MAG: alpha/beta fold hydrolase [Gemmatimonadetes bacterium]|nr:alpha/beta fold hydrolase [Gemmatimonadota bacterium]
MDPLPRFTPPPLLSGPHVQTLLGKALRPRPATALDVYRLELEDGDFLDLALSPLCADTSRPIVLVLHGLEGSARRRYMLLTYEALLRHGLAPVGLNFRGCSGEPNRTARAYHSGDTEDLARVTAWLRRRFPDRRLGLVGFSLGGNVVLKYLGERGEGGTPYHAAVAISVPFDLAAGSLELERPGPYTIYRQYFLRSLQRKAAGKAALIEGRADLSGALSARTLRAFDDALTAPLHGFAGAAEYYALSSSGPYVPRVRTPTLVIQAMDDPFLPEGCVPVGEIQRNPWTTALLPRYGGHVGFVSERPGEERFWAEEHAARFVARHLAFTPTAGP